MPLPQKHFDRSVPLKKMKRILGQKISTRASRRLAAEYFFLEEHKRLNYLMVRGIVDALEKCGVKGEKKQREIMKLEQKATTLSMMKKKLRERFFQRRSLSINLLTFVAKMLLSEADGYLLRNKNKKTSLWRYVADFRELYDPRYRNFLRDWEGVPKETPAIEIVGDKNISNFGYLVNAAQRVVEDSIKAKIKNPGYFEEIRKLRKRLSRIETGMNLEN